MLTGAQFVFLAAAAAVALVPALCRPAGPRGAGATAAAVIGLAYLIAHAGLAGGPRWAAWEHQPAWIALGALAVTVPFAACKPDCPWARRLAAALLAGALGAVVRPAAVAEWGSGSECWLWLAGLTVLAAVVLERTALLAARAPGVSVPAAAAIVAGGASVLALLSHYATFALLGASLALAFVPLCAALLLRRDAQARQGAVLCGMAIALSLLLGGYLHSLAADRVSGVWFLAAGAAPLIAWLPALGGERRMRTRRGALLRVALVLLAVLGAAAGGAIEATRDSDAGGVSEWEFE